MHVVCSLCVRCARFSVPMCVCVCIRYQAFVRFGIYDDRACINLFVRSFDRSIVCSFVRLLAHLLLFSSFARVRFASLLLLLIIIILLLLVVVVTLVSYHFIPCYTVYSIGCLRSSQKGTKKRSNKKEKKKTKEKK